MQANEMALSFMDLLQKISSGNAPSLEDFELSYALSTAEEEFIKTKYSPKSNVKREGFENSEKRRKDLSQLVTNVIVPPDKSLIARDSLAKYSVDSSNG